MNVANKLAALKAWSKGQAQFSDDVEYAARYLSLSAIFLRWLRFGAEESLNDIDAKTMMQMLIMASDKIAMKLLPIIYMRAVVLEEIEVRQLLEESGLIQIQHAWVQSFESTSDHAKLAQLIVSEDVSEARYCARLLAGRSNPAVITDDWFAADNQPDVHDHLLIVHQTCFIAAQTRPDLCAAILTFLMKNHQVLLCHQPDLLLSNLVKYSSSRPQEVLASLEGCYGEHTLLAAALWHWEHDEQDEALALTGSVRHLAPIFNEACLIRCQIFSSAKDPHALDLAAQIESPNLARQALASLAQHFPEKISDDILGKAILSCSNEEPETAFQLTAILVKHFNIIPDKSIIAHLETQFPESTQIRQLCHQLQGAQHDHEP